NPRRGGTPQPAVVQGQGRPPQNMIETAIRKLVEACTRRPWTVVATAVVVTVARSIYAAGHFAINTDVMRLISPDLPWRQRELAVSAAFPQTSNVVLIVIDATSSENASRAARTLAAAL